MIYKRAVLRVELSRPVTPEMDLDVSLDGLVSLLEPAFPEWKLECGEFRLEAYQ